MRGGYLQFQPEFGKVDKNINKVTKLLSGEKFDLIVLPELANSGYLFADKKELVEFSEEIPSGRFCRAMFEIAEEKNAFIVSGICEREGDNFYNSSVVFKPDGSYELYRKIHLFDREKLWFTPGEVPLRVFELHKEGIKSFRAGMMICFDWIFPEAARTIALNGAQLICHPSNLVMSYCQNAMSTRALENHVFIITANRIGKEANGGMELFFTGESVIVDPKGNYLARASVNEEEIKIVDMDLTKALDKNINPANDLFKDRRENFYFK
jgi:predicted amidohydrolase